MELNDTILGFLDWKPLTGYELKGLFSTLEFLPWSGNNNQIYKALLELEKESCVEKEVILQENYPTQKRYSVTQKGRERLWAAVRKNPDAPFVKNDFLLHLAWADCLPEVELIHMIDSYQLQVENELTMSREKIRRDDVHAKRSERESYIWDMIGQNRAEFLQNELNWLTKLRNGLSGKGGPIK